MPFRNYLTCICLQNISKHIQTNISTDLFMITQLLKEDNSKNNFAILAEIFMLELIYCLYTVKNIEIIYQELNNDSGNNDYDYVETLPITKHPVLIEIELLNIMFGNLVQKLGHEISFQTISTVYLQYNSTCSLFKRFTSLDNPRQYINDFQELYHISQNLRTIMSTYQKFDY